MDHQQYLPRIRRAAASASVDHFLSDSSAVNDLLSAEYAYDHPLNHRGAPPPPRWPANLHHNHPYHYSNLRQQNNHQISMPLNVNGLQEPPHLPIPGRTASPSVGYFLRAAAYPPVYVNDFLYAVYQGDPRWPVSYQYHSYHYPNLGRQYDDENRRHSMLVNVDNLQESEDGIMTIDETGLQHVENQSNAAPQWPVPYQYQQQFYDGIRQLGMPLNVNNLQESDHDIMIIDELSLQDVDNPSNVAPEAQIQTQRHGGLEADISSYLKVRNSGVGDGECDDICVVCQDALCQEDLKIGKLHCGHEYHVHCITQWLHCKNTCPLCQAIALPIPVSSLSS